jgi:hypothetical protein
MQEESLARRFIEPIDNASKPATIATLNFAVVILIPTQNILDLVLRTLLGVGGLMLMLSSFAVFFFSVYPTRRRLWLVGALAFLIGLSATIVATALAVTISFG